MKRKLIWVKWKDACFRNDDWHSADEIETKERFHCESVGLFVKEDKQGLVIAVDFDPDTGKWRGLSFIPRKMIRRRKVFTVDVK